MQQKHTDTGRRADEEFMRSDEQNVVRASIECAVAFSLLFSTTCGLG